MALSKATLAGMIKANIETEFGPADDQAMLNKFAKAVADAVVDHITAEATITFNPGDIPVQVSLVTGIGANTAGAPLKPRIT